MDSAVAVQAKGLAVRLKASTKVSILRTNSLTLAKEPRRMARFVMMPKKISTWLSHEE